ncbi:MAG: glutamine-hydrolyzing carbamoyl-phosphate synthase small subunit [Iamia sp.]
MSRREVRPALLVLADGEVFEGEALGAEPDSGIATGEVVFNTVLSGYQEVISDPSYAGQVITFTYPHIGNYGIAAADDESRRPFCRGVIVREPARRRSSWRSDEDLDAWLRRHRVPAIGGIDTRRLTRHIRDEGAAPGAFGVVGPAPDGTVVDEAALRAAATAEPGTDGVDLVAQVTTAAPYTVGDGPRRVVAYDLGIKTTILRHLSELATVEVVPASTSAAEVLAREPDGVFLSNGPGDPATVPHVVEAIGGLIGEVPLFGICLGNQLLARAIGAETVKLPFGHHGGNHPVRDVRTGRIDITSQNHSFAVAADTLPAGAEMTHVNLNDGVCEGFALPDERAFSVQHHPEAGPGPHDAAHLFAAFDQLMAGDV